ncbi:MAG: glycerol-3-phosphate dehydrogenase/oxidase [Alphaproteobacteria bacterium]
MTGFDLRNRQAIFNRLEAETFDVLIIGGGITGAGLAREVAMRGLACALVEASDFAAGTSSRSSKLVHGGLRYLAQGDFGVVREASRERAALRQIAPHLARVNPMLVTARSRKEQWIIKAGLIAFEKLGRVAKNERHHMVSAAQLQEIEPAIKPGRFAGACHYYEYLTDDARLTLANVQDAALHGAVTVNYARATKAIIEQNTITGFEVQGTLPGETLGATIKAKQIINAAGPWVDALRSLEDADAAKRLILTKGIHACVPRSRLPLNNTVTMRGPDGRNVFVVPKGDIVYFGTTDTFYADADYWPTITFSDIAYLLESGNDTFGGNQLTPADVCGLWSGVRPLLGEEGKAPSDISRKDEILEGPHGMISIAGGKLTAYRKMAARLADQIANRLGRPCDTPPTDTLPLPGGDIADLAQFEASLAQQFGLSSAQATKLTTSYGAHAAAALATADSAPFGPAHEARYAVTHEGAQRLEDWWVRRSGRAWYDLDGGISALDEAATAMAAQLDWDDARKASEIKTAQDARTAMMAALDEH